MRVAQVPKRTAGNSIEMAIPRLTRWVLLIITLIGSAAYADKKTDKESDAIMRGGYLVELLGCGRCHTEGLLTGDAALGPHLAGSRVGIAYTAYNEQLDLPGVVFPGNLTPDPATGLGSWSRDRSDRRACARHR